MAIGACLTFDFCDVCCIASHAQNIVMSSTRLCVCVLGGARHHTCRCHELCVVSMNDTCDCWAVRYMTFLHTIQLRFVRGLRCRQW